LEIGCGIGENQFDSFFLYTSGKHTFLKTAFVRKQDCETTEPVVMEVERLAEFNIFR